MSTIESVREFVSVGVDDLDVFCVLIVLFAADVTVLTAESVPIRTVAGIPLLLVLPGYGLVMLLLPRARTESSRFTGAFSPATSGRAARGVSLGERAALSFGTSVALLPILVLVLAALGRPLDTVSIVAGVSVVCLLGVVLGAIRRRRLPESERFRLPIASWFGRLRAATVGAPTRADAVVNVALVLAVVVGTGGFVVAETTAMAEDSYTTMAVLDQNDSGTFVAGDYPSELTRNGAEDLLVRVENEEGAPTTYRLVGELQQVDTTGDGVAVTRRERVETASVSLADGERWDHRHEITPQTTGTDLRLTYYLYRGEVPDQPSTESAYRHVHLWVDVTEQAGAQSTNATSGGDA